MPARCSPRQGVLPDVVYTSLLRRAISTANFALDAADRHWIPVVRDWRLNERHYGALQGKNKAETKDEFGDEQFMLWRRSYDTPPPPIEAGIEVQPGHRCPVRESRRGSADRVPEGRRRAVHPVLGGDHLARTCSPERRCWSPHTATRCVRSSSTSTASPIEDIAGLNIPTGIPLRYDLDENLAPLNPVAPTSTPRPPLPAPRQSRTRARRSTCRRRGPRATRLARASANGG